MSEKPTSLSPLLVAGAASWLLLVGGGLFALERYVSTAADAPSPPERWPEASHLARGGDRGRLLVFVHPRCPCSRATLGELALALAGASPESLETSVLFYRPGDEPDAWAHTDLWDTASAIPGVRVATDPDGVEADRFDATTSGFAVLFDREGALVFAGGLTAARGHHGDNEGRRAVTAIARGEAPARSRTPVFGCPILDPSSCGAECCEEAAP